MSAKRTVLLLTALLTLAAAASVRADDWPEFRGKDRKGEWNETGILEKFPAEGLKVLWRTPVKEGYSSPVVSGGRVFLTDFTRVRGDRGNERAVAIDEKTGRILWTTEWESDYGGFMWPNGPRATPTVDGDRVYVLGARGMLLCLDVSTGAVIWKKDYVAEYKTSVSSTGAGSAPVVEGPLVMAIVGGEDSLVVAWDKRTGREAWRSLSYKGDPGVAQPIVITAGSARQLIIWAPDGLHSLAPATGRLYWTLAFKTSASMNIPVPVLTGHRLLLSNFYTGAMVIALDDKTPQARIAWRGKNDSEIDTDTLNSVIGTPVVLGDYIYGVCSYGQLRCLREATGERVWETQVVTKERARWASAHIVKNRDRQFIYNDRGELMIARLTPEGYQEIDRTNLLKPTTAPGVRRLLPGVNVVHPAYANRNIYVRNDEEIISASLASTGAAPTRPTPVASVSRAASPVARGVAQRSIEVQYIPSLSSDRRKAERDAEYSTLYLLFGGGAHSLAFASGQGVVLVNTKSPGWGQAIIDKLPLITESPVTTLINTHPDSEYVGGNSAFPGAVTIASHVNTRAAMAQMAAFKGPNAKFLPNKTFTNTMTLGTGKNRVDLYYFGAGHTNGDSVVVIPLSNLAYLGELFPARELPIIDSAHGGSAVAFPDTLERALETLKAHDVQFIVPGRAEALKRVGAQVDVLTLKDLQEYVEFNRAFLSAAKAAKQSGKTVDEAAATLKMPDAYKNYGMERARTNIQAIYDELRK